MSRSNNAGHFFQTSEALATTKRKADKAKNKHGNPIKLPSKILAAHIDPYSSIDEPAIFVAEAAGEVKRVNLESGRIDRIFSQGNAPITCLALCHETRTLFAGSWDKTIYAISLDDPKQVKKLQGHTDFIKCLCVTTLPPDEENQPHVPILLSGSADTTIIIWSTLTSQPLHKLKSHTQALQSLTLDPSSPSETPQVLFTGTSSPELRRFSLSLSSSSPISAKELSPSSPLRPHETSIYALTWDSSGEDLWTASADKSAKRLVRNRNWEADTVLEHPDFVRDVVVFDELGVVVTACRDEDVRVWDSGSGEMRCRYHGHYEEVTGLVPLLDGRSVASVSIDGTVRRWGVDEGSMERYREEVERGGEGKGEGDEGGGMLTAEEEAELAELMDDE